MPVIVRIPGPLRNLTSGNAEVQVEATDVAGLFETINQQYQGLSARLCEANGALRRFVNVYVNDEDIRFLGNLQTPLKPGDVVSIIPAIAGG